MSAFLEAMRADLQALVGPDISVDLGEFEVLKNQAPPRIVLEPTRDVFGQYAARQPVGTVEPRAFLTCTAGVTAYVVGKPTAGSRGFTETETLRDTFLSALKSSVLHDYRIHAGEWGKQSLTNFGVAYRVHLTIATPIVDTFGAHAATTITGETGAVGITGGDGETVQVQVP